MPFKSEPLTKNLDDLSNNLRSEEIELANHMEAIEFNFEDTVIEQCDESIIKLPLQNNPR